MPDEQRTATDAFSGAAAGASAGIIFGPWGAAVGGVLGGAFGALGSISSQGAEDARLRALRRAREIGLSQVAQNERRALEDNERDAERILGRIRVAASGSGVAPQASIARQIGIDLERNAADLRRRADLQRYEVLTSIQSDINKIKASIPSAAEGYLSALTDGLKAAGAIYGSIGAAEGAAELPAGATELDAARQSGAAIFGGGFA